MTKDEIKEQMISLGELAQIISRGQKVLSPEPKRKPKGVLGKLRGILTRAMGAVAQSRLSEALELLWDALDEVDMAEKRRGR